MRFGRARFGRDIDLALLRAISAWVCFAVGFRFVWLFSGRRGCFHGIQLAKLPRVALTASLDAKRAPGTPNLAVCVGIWQSLGVFGSIWEYLRVSESILEYLGVSGSIWEHLSLSERIWEHSGVSGSLWEYR